MSRLSLPSVTSSSQIPGGNPVGGVIAEIFDDLLPNRLRPDSSSSFASLNRFLNALNARFSSSSVATVLPPRFRNTSRRREYSTGPGDASRSHRRAGELQRPARSRTHGGI